MDTVRIHQTPAVSPVHENVWFAVGLVGGLVLLALGIMRNSTVLVGIGFVPFLVSFLYLHSMFWAWVFERTGVERRYQNNPERWKYWI